jgi:acetylornithine deacetylase/succinyl-diaminopimelate desuccinylase-like protein
MTQAVESWLEAEKPRLLAELFELIRCPSVSTDPAYADGMAKAADLLLVL